jgi:hypothetical protein
MRFPNRLRAWVLHVALTACMGLGAYAAWRPQRVPVSSLLPHLPAEPSAGDAWFSPALRGVWPDACWAWAVCAAMALVWADGRPAWRRAWCMVAWGLVPGAELLQGARLLNGTFDPADLTAACVSEAVALVLNGPPNASHRSTVPAAGDHTA